jgi:iron complex outermembrane receptor protein
MSAPVLAQPPAAVDLASMSLEELMDVEVSLTGRRERPLFETAAAVSVLTADDLRRSGATSIAEALRLIPGMVVAHVDANKWAISARGFNGRFGNKLLVLIDGRSVYTPTFSGVFWEVQDVILEDVERIEVIRGPGATLWGANAVNGIINVVTRSAAETQGSLTTIAAGTEERAAAGLRYGGRGEHVAWRVYGKAFDRDGFVDAEGGPTADDWWLGRGGLRLDWSAGSDDVMVQAEAHRGDAGQTFRLASLQPPYSRLVDADTKLAGAHVMGRWQRVLRPGSSLVLQLFYDRIDRTELVIDEVRDTWDLDFQHRLGWGRGHETIWGFGYRYTTNETKGSFSVSLDPPGRGEDVISAFVQDAMSLADGRGRLTAGSKFEHNDHTGFEVQPSARLWWELRPSHAVWMATSRALRVPSQADEDVRLQLQVTPPDSSGAVPPTILTGFGADLESEELSAFELGYRSQPASALVVDVAGFFNVYRGVRGGRVGGFYTESEPAPVHLVLPFYNINGLNVETWGLEVAADWRLAAGRWRLRPAYAFLDMRARAVNGSDPLVEEVADESPEHQWSLWSSADLGRGLQLDGVLRYVDGLPTHDFGAYLVADLRAGWQVSSGLELELVGRNLLDARHPEFQPFFIDTLPTQTQPEAYLRVRWQPGR